MAAPSPALRVVPLPRFAEEDARRGVGSNVHRPAVSAREIILAALPDDVGRRFVVYADLLARWQKTINLVAPSSVPDLWRRHVGDSLQVQAAAPTARAWVDLGSGGGFPGLVTAILLADTPGAVVHLVESDKRKAAFLRNVSRETSAPAQVHAERIETFVPAHAARVDAVSARALAPLPQLVTFAEKFLLDGAIGVFPKGQHVEPELTALERDRRFRIESRPSLTRDQSCLVIVTAALPISGHRVESEPWRSPKR